MAIGLSGHLDNLLGLASTAPDATTEDDNSISNWLSQPVIDWSVSDDLDEDEPWPSVLDVFAGQPEANPPGLVAEVMSLPNAHDLVHPLLSVLSSSHTNDQIYGELVDLLGFDQIDLASSVLNQRRVVVKELVQLGESGDKPAASTSKPDTPSSKPDSDLSSQAARKRLERQLKENASRPLTTGVRPPTPEILPHVYTSSGSQGNILSQSGNKFLLPLGTTRDQNETYEEVIIPPAKPVPPKTAERLIPVPELDPLARGCFPGYSNLNRIQSIVYPTAYGTNENMLICAPTGAGKTDVAMLTILRVLDQHRSKSNPQAPIASTINRNEFKIIYVAPMKALASEIVRKFSKRLRWLSVSVRELTGDMQMTKAEIAETQIIVTTPEKWDVVTRKPTGEGEIASALKLLIIDEVHLLNEERGAVIETIVARTLRQVESSQSVIRILGLSATLPNYVDVAEFLSVSPKKGLFYFDSSFRPVPLEQHFLGIRGKPGSALSKKNLDHVTYEKVSELVAQGHQVMVFVHARKETVKAALNLRENAMLEGTLDGFSCETHPQWSLFRRDIGESRNKEMKQLFDSGFGIHHAGMLRTDRNMMERMFEARAIKVLCCTATLAWGVNLPAHAVVIKGTQVYDSGKGKFGDLSVLDVLQVFGRAGRPGMETSGEGYICTTEDKLNHYLERVTSQIPIESQFQGGLIDSLNAEIALGTVANANDASQWLRWTYLFVRMKKNPMYYGMVWDTVSDDPHLVSKRSALVDFSAQKLANTGMITIDPHTKAYTITDLGRIAAKYYIRHASIEKFEPVFKPIMSEADVLHMLSLSTEFEQVQLRESEMEELEGILELDVIHCDIKGIQDKKAGDKDEADKGGKGRGGDKDGKGKGKVITSSEAKVNILLQAHISNHYLEDFALISDSAYCAQNGGRIIRALLEIALSRKWAGVSGALMRMSKAIEKRLWPFEHPLKQFNLKREALHNIETWADDWPVDQLATLSAKDLGDLIHLNEQNGFAVLNAAKQFPTAKITYDLRPLAHDVLQVTIHLYRSFSWNAKTHGTSEPFWLWIETNDGKFILQLSHLSFKASSEDMDVEFLIPIPNGNAPPSVTIRFLSDRWLSAEDELEVPLTSLLMPAPFDSHTPLLDLPFLSPSVLRNTQAEALFASRIRTLNAIQSQTFWSLVHTRLHSLLCAPVGNGKSMMAQLIIWSTVLQLSEAFVLIVVARKDAASELISDLQMFGGPTGVTVDISDGPHVLKRYRGKVIRVVTAANLRVRMTAINPRTSINYIDLVICDQLENLDAQYELGVSLLRHAVQSSPTRFIGFSSSLSDPVDLGAWLGATVTGLHSFRPSDRDHSLAVCVKTFTIPQSAALFKAMAKPAYTAIQTAEGSEPAIVFVPSRGQCLSIARDLITQCTLQTTKTSAFLPPTMSEIILEDYLARFQDRFHVEFASKGVGFFHSGLKRSDRILTLQMYAEGIIRVLIVPRESCWSLPVRSSVVVVMGTQYLHITSVGDTESRQLRDYSLTELVHMQGRAVQHSGRGQFHLFCQAESKDSFLRFLNKGLPLESQLLNSPLLQSWYDGCRKSGSIGDKQAAVDALSFTYLFLRISSNPVYYDCKARSRNVDLSKLVDRLEAEYIANSGSIDQ
ncbi:putative steryl acetyl hydrolase mug81 [Pleurotus ostreatus]|nr:putative steryl acetyl hydrolase mug81 [Pleurotus ostreatus]